jgi:hypothetical protein
MFSPFSEEFQFKLAAEAFKFAAFVGNEGSH